MKFNILIVTKYSEFLLNFAIVSIMYNSYVRKILNRDYGVQEAAGSNPVTRTMRSVLIGSEYPTKDTPHFLLSKLGRHRFHRTATDPGCTGALPYAE